MLSIFVPSLPASKLAAHPADQVGSALTSGPQDQSLPRWWLTRQFRGPRQKKHWRLRHAKFRRRFCVPLATSLCVSDTAETGWDRSGTFSKPCTNLCGRVRPLRRKWA